MTRLEVVMWGAIGGLLYMLLLLIYRLWLTRSWKKVLPPKLTEAFIVTTVFLVFIGGAASSFVLEGVHGLHPLTPLFIGLASAGAAIQLLMLAAANASSLPQSGPADSGPNIAAASSEAPWKERVGETLIWVTAPRVTAASSIVMAVVAVLAFVTNQ
jgi:hypothetical protein